MYGVCIPHDTKEELKLDEENGEDIVSDSYNSTLEQIDAHGRNTSIIL